MYEVHPHPRTRARTVALTGAHDYAVLCFSPASS